MEQAQDFEGSRPAFLGYSKQYEMPPSAVGSRYVQGKESLRDVGFLFHADGRGSIGQGFKCGGDSVFVSEGLLFAELLKSPTDDVPKVGLRSSG